MKTLHWIPVGLLVSSSIVSCSAEPDIDAPSLPRLPENVDPADASLGGYAGAAGSAGSSSSSGNGGFGPSSSSASSSSTASSGAGAGSSSSSSTSGVSSSGAGATGASSSSATAGVGGAPSTTGAGAASTATSASSATSAASASGAGGAGTGGSGGDGEEVPSSGCETCKACSVPYKYCCSTGQCALALGCFGGIYVGGCSCCYEWYVDPFSLDILCLDCGGLEDVFDLYCPGGGECAGGCGGDDAEFDQPEPVVWDEQLGKCVERGTKEPTDRRNPYPGPCGELTGDHEAFVQDIERLILDGDSWKQPDVVELLDYSGEDLRGMRFSGEFALIKLEGARLEGADLSDASFIAADLRGVDFYKANLRGTLFLGADFSPSPNYKTPMGQLPDKPRATTLNGVDARGASFAMSKLVGTYIVQSDFSGVSAPSAVFDGAFVAGTNLSDAQMPQASFVGTVLVRIPTGGGNYAYNNLRGADFRLGDFRGARFLVRKEDLTGANFDYANLCDTTGSYDDFSAAETKGSFVQDAKGAKANQARGYLWVNPRRCATFAPSTSVKFDEREVSTFEIADGDKLAPLFFYDYTDLEHGDPRWTEDPAYRYPKNEKNQKSPAWPLLESGRLVNIARYRGDYPERGKVYLMRYGKTFIAYTHEPFKNETFEGHPSGQDGSLPTWWERRIVARGMAPLTIAPGIVAEAYYYDQQQIQQLENIAVGLEMFYTGLSLIPGVGTLKIPLEAMILGKDVFSTENAVTVTLDAAALFTFGASKLANPQSYKALYALQTMRVGAAVTLAAGTGYFAYKAGQDFEKGNTFGAAVDVGAVLINALLLRKNIKDFYKTKTILGAFKDFKPQHFPTTPLALTDNAEINKLREMFSEWMAHSTTSAQIKLSKLMQKGEVTVDDLAKLATDLGTLRYQKAVDMATKKGPEELAKLQKFGKPITEPNFDPWGTNGGLPGPQKAAREEIGGIVKKRLEEANTEELANEYLKSDGVTKVEGVKLYGGEKAKKVYADKGGPEHYKPGVFEPVYFTATSSGPAQTEIFRDGLRRWARLLGGKAKYPSRDEALRDYAAGLYAYFQGLPVNRGGDSIGRVLGAAVFRNAFGKTVALPKLVDAQAYAMKQCDFVEMLLPILKAALK